MSHLHETMDVNLSPSASLSILLESAMTDPTRSTWSWALQQIITTGNRRLEAYLSSWRWSAIDCHHTLWDKKIIHLGFLTKRGGMTRHEPRTNYIRLKWSTSDSLSHIEFRRERLAPKNVFFKLHILLKGCIHLWVIIFFNSWKYYSWVEICYQKATSLSMLVRFREFWQQIISLDIFFYNLEF